MIAHLKNLKTQTKLLAALLIVILIGIIPFSLSIAARSGTPAPGATRVVEKDGMVQVYVPPTKDRRRYLQCYREPDPNSPNSDQIISILYRRTIGPLESKP